MTQLAVLISINALIFSPGHALTQSDDPQTFRANEAQRIMRSRSLKRSQIEETMAILHDGRTQSINSDDQIAVDLDDTRSAGATRRANEAQTIMRSRSLKRSQMEKTMSVLHDGRTQSINSDDQSAVDLDDTRFAGATRRLIKDQRTLEKEGIAKRVNSTEKGWFCYPYEVCKCITTSDDRTSRCDQNSCTYSPDAPSLCCPPPGGWWCDDADCKNIKSWQDCEWANFPKDTAAKRAGGMFPGEGLFVDVPKATPRSNSGPKGVTVLTDVDDTIKCSGGGPAGVDATCLGCKPHKMYPGVAEFTLALARGPSNITQPPKVVPLSARPEELKKFLAMKANSPEGEKYAEAAKRVGISDWGLDVEGAQYGTLYGFIDAAAAMIKHDTDITRFDKMGYRKYSNWKNVANKFGTMSMFIGDNGQGDVVAAEMMLKRSSVLEDSEGALRAAFIHDALGKCGDETCKTTWAQYGILFFKHYVDAAGQALSHELISPTGCKSVCDAAPEFECMCA